MTICYVNWGFPQTGLTCAALPPPALPVMQPGAVIPAGPVYQLPVPSPVPTAVPGPVPVPVVPVMMSPAGDVTPLLVLGAVCYRTLRILRIGSRIKKGLTTCLEKCLCQGTYLGLSHRLQALRICTVA